MEFQLQLESERLFNNNQLIPRIKREFQENGWDRRLDEAGIDRMFGYDVLAQMYLHKRTDVPTLVGIMRKHFEQYEDGSQRTADLLLKCVAADLMDYDKSIQKFIFIWDLAQSVKDELDMFQFPMPMVIPPKPVKKNTDTGYLTIKRSIVSHHHVPDEEFDLCLDHINKQNAIPLKLSSEIIRMCELKWRHLDHPKEDESLTDYQDRVKAFKKYQETAYDVMDRFNLLGQDIYVTNRYDFRGRTYANGYHVNPQGAEFNKAVVMLAEGELIE